MNWFDRRDKYADWRESAGSLCEYCGVDTTGTKWLQQFTVDHKLPKSRGGADKKDNWAVCCKKCNALKGNLTVTEFLVVMDYWSSKNIVPIFSTKEGKSVDGVRFK